MRGLRAASITLTLTACALLGPGSPPARVDPPPTNEPAQIGVAYGVITSCPIPIRVGDKWWSFDEPDRHWPPPQPAEESVSPYSVPGIVTLSSATTAVFRADSDGSEWALTGTDTNPMEGYGCL